MPRAVQTKGPAIEVWLTSADGQQIQSTSDQCEFRFCTIEDEAGLLRCATEEECVNAEFTSEVAIIAGALVLILAITIILLIMCDNKFRRCLSCFNRCKKVFCCCFYCCDKKSKPDDKDSGNRA